MQWPLILAGLALGLAATPHCAVMCGAPCAAVTHGSGRAASGFHAGRLIGYAAGGALAAGSVSLLGAWSQAAPALRPIWTLLHLGFLALGLWWLATGRQWAMSRGAGAGDGTRTGAVNVPVRVLRSTAHVARAGVAGLGWVAWPCAALQGALMLAALAGSPEGGALVMAAFALASAPGLAMAPWLWARWRAARGRGASAQQVSTLGFRVAGAGLALVSGWALTHGLWERFAQWCAGT
jgi:uncharacterized protein